MAQELKAETIVPKGSAVSLQMYPKADVDAALAEKDAEIRRLKRALWLARAERARWESCYYWYAVSRKHDSRMYDEVERKCRAKAEQYK